MTKNLKSFLLLLMVGMFGMLLTVSCGADDVLSDVEDATGNGEPTMEEPTDSLNNYDGNKGNEDSSVAEDADTVWTEYTQMAAKLLVGKWQKVYTLGKVGVYDEQLQIFEDGTVKHYCGGKVSEATYRMRNDWAIREGQENLYDITGVDAYGNPTYNRRICKYKMLFGGVTPKQAVDGRKVEYLQNDFVCGIRIEGEPSDRGELIIAPDDPYAIYCADPAQGYKRIE